MLYLKQLLLLIIMLTFGQDVQAERLLIDRKVVEKNFGSHYAKGYKLYLDEEYSKAENELSKSVAERPDQLRTRQTRALVLLEEKKSNRRL